MMSPTGLSCHPLAQHTNLDGSVLFARSVNLSVCKITSTDCELTTLVCLQYQRYQAQQGEKVADLILAPSLVEDNPLHYAGKAAMVLNHAHHLCFELLLLCRATSTLSHQQKA